MFSRGQRALPGGTAIALGSGEVVEPGPEPCAYRRSASSQARLARAPLIDMQIARRHRAHKIDHAPLQWCRTDFDQLETGHRSAAGTAAMKFIHEGSQEAHNRISEPCA
jgi:hypothetical protein